MTIGAANDNVAPLPHHQHVTTTTTTWHCCHITVAHTCSIPSFAHPAREACFFNFVFVLFFVYYSHARSQPCL
jgi:hypothetical protein